MIGRVLPRGQKVGGLVRYLYGPGKHEEHRNPHIVASWSGETVSLEPAVTAAGMRDFRGLVGLLEAPLAQLEPWVRTEQPVYHVAVRAAAEDRLLSDAEWAALATEMMHNIGLSRRDGAEDGVRWVAVRHADDHIHIVATLARADGTPPRRGNDFFRVRDTCQVFERRYRLRSTAPADNTAAKRPHRAEVEKALRAGRHETVRDRLRREVRNAAAAAVDEADFFQRLDRAGVMVQLRHSKVDPAQVTGYSVTMPGTKTAAGTLVYYGGGKLAADLTLPKLRMRWVSPAVAGDEAGAAEASAGAGSAARTAPGPADRRRVVEEAAASATAAEEEVRGAARTRPDDVAGTVYAAADLAAATARAVEGGRGGRLSTAADAFDHAAREPFGRVPPLHGRAQHLRASARLLAALRRIDPENEALQVAELLSRLASLAETVAMLRRLEQRTEQARAAQRAAAELQAVAAEYSMYGQGPSPAGGRRAAASPRTGPQVGPQVGPSGGKTSQKRPPARPPGQAQGR